MQKKLFNKSINNFPFQNLMSEYLKFAYELADASGKVIRKDFRSKMTDEDKKDNSPVTVADRLA